MLFSPTSDDSTLVKLFADKNLLNKNEKPLGRLQLNLSTISSFDPLNVQKYHAISARGPRSKKELCVESANFSQDFKKKQN
jgi:hypothetical protein